MSKGVQSLETNGAPEIMTTFLASPVTAVVSAARVVTVVWVPPEPPVVLKVVLAMKGRYM